MCVGSISILDFSVWRTFYCTCSHDQNNENEVYRFVTANSHMQNYEWRMTVDRHYYDEEPSCTDKRFNEMKNESIHPCTVFNGTE